MNQRSLAPIKNEQFCEQLKMHEYHFYKDARGELDKLIEVAKKQRKEDQHGCVWVK